MCGGVGIPIEIRGNSKFKTPNVFKITYSEAMLRFLITLITAYFSFFAALANAEEENPLGIEQPHLTGPY